MKILDFREEMSSVAPIETVLAERNLRAGIVDDAVAVERDEEVVAGRGGEAEAERDQKESALEERSKWKKKREREAEEVAQETGRGVVHLATGSAREEVAVAIARETGKEREKKEGVRVTRTSGRMAFPWLRRRTSTPTQAMEGTTRTNRMEKRKKKDRGKKNMRGEEEPEIKLQQILIFFLTLH